MKTDKGKREVIVQKIMRARRENIGIPKGSSRDRCGRAGEFFFQAVEEEMPREDIIFELGKRHEYLDHIYNYLKHKNF